MTKPSKTTVETVKTVIIAVLVTAVVAFLGGMHYQNKINVQVKSAVVEATSKK